MVDLVFIWFFCIVFLFLGSRVLVSDSTLRFRNFVVEKILISRVFIEWARVRVGCLVDQSSDLI